MIKLFNILLSIVIFLVPYALTNMHIGDLGVMQKRKEYDFVIKQKRGIIVFNRRADGEQQDYRLPLKYEEDDVQLYEMLEQIEGDDSFVSLYKGVFRGAATTVGLGNLGGGSTLITSASGSLLGQRVPPPDTHLWRSVWQRLREWVVSGYINSLPATEKRKLVLNEICQIGTYTGCTLVATRAFGRLPKDNVERLFLAATVRYSGGDREKIISYMKKICQAPRMKAFKLGNCNKIGDFVRGLNYRDDINITGIISNKIVVNNEDIDLVSLVNLFEQAHVYDPKKILIEISVYEWQKYTEKSKQIALVSNSEFILRNNGFQNTNVASVAKLLLLLSAKSFDEHEINAMRISENAKIEQAFRERESEIRREIIKLGLRNMTKKFNAHRASYGLLHMSSGDVHVMLNHVAQQNQHRRIATAALFGTLGHLRNQFSGLNVLVAKSGTDASRANGSSRADGVYGSLVVYYVEKGNNNFSVVIRMHAVKNNRAICIQPSCTKTDMANIVKTTINLIQNTK